MTDEWKDALLIPFEPARTHGFQPIRTYYYKTAKAIRAGERCLLRSRAVVCCISLITYSKYRNLYLPRFG